MIYLYRTLCILFACVAVTHATAQEFPTKPMRFVVPNNPGILPDILARVMSKEMAKSFGQPVIVENKTGAGQLVAYEYVAKQLPADGYSFIIVSIPVLSSMPATVKDLRFDPLTDLTPVLGIAESQIMLATSAQSPWKSMNELVAYAKANPGKLNFGSSSNVTRLYTEAVLQNMGLSMVHIPYNASGPYTQAMVNGDFHVGITSETTVISVGERLRVLLVTGAQRMAAYPNAPTFGEIGQPLIKTSGYQLSVRNGTPKVASQRIYQAALASMRDPEVLATAAKFKLQIVEESADAAAKRMNEQGRLFIDLANRVGLKPE